MFLIHLVEDLYVLGFPTWGLGQRWRPLGGCRSVYQLYLLDTYACGTARVSRKEMPEAFKKSVSKEIKLTRGSGIFRTRDQLLALKYHDKRDIHMLSTIHTSKCVIFDKERF